VRFHSPEPAKRPPAGENARPGFAASADSMRDADIKLVQAVARRANPLITLKRYSHLLDARVTEAAERFGPARAGTPHPDAV
jgi:hypothetical protein